jgi:hypothetical protein
MVRVNWATRTARVQAGDGTAVVLRAHGVGTTAGVAPVEPLSDEVKG